MITLKRPVPILKYSTADEYRAYLMKRMYNHKRSYDSTYYPCYKCLGSGKIRNIKDLCTIEGYKDAPWYKCDKCMGTGAMHPSMYFPIIEDEYERYTTESRAYEIDEAWLCNIMDKLTEDDIEFILTNIIITRST